MGRVKMTMLAGAAAIFSPAALAADLPPVMHPPIVRAPVVEEFSAWYLRGDIGITNQKVEKFHNILFDTAVNFQFVDKGSFTTGTMFGLGVGFQWNHWLRFDVTGEFRGSSKFHAMDRFTNGAVVNTNEFSAVKSEWVFLANAFLDLGTWWCLTPFVGAGIGFSHITIDHFRDNNIIAGGGGFAETGTKFNFAWALHAGIAHKVTPNFTVELAYRFLSLGDGQTDDLKNLDGTNIVIGNAMHFKDITSHDFKLGVRWSLEQEQAKQPVFIPPLMRRG